MLSPTYGLLTKQRLAGALESVNLSPTEMSYSLSLLLHLDSNLIYFLSAGRAEQSVLQKYGEVGLTCAGGHRMPTSLVATPPIRGPAENY